MLIKIVMKRPIKFFAFSLYGFELQLGGAVQSLRVIYTISTN